MFGPFRLTNPLSGGLLWKVPWRLSRHQKYRHRERLRGVDKTVSIVDTALARLGQTLKKVEMWKKEMPTEQEMLPKDKYTVFDRKVKRYRKGIHRQPPTGAVPPAVMEEYLKLTQKQQERRDSFELRAADVRRHFAELDANEHHHFWTSYSSHVSQVGGGSNGHNVHVNQAGANIPSRPQQIPQRADNPPLPPPSQSQRKKPAQPAAQQKTKPVPLLLLKKPPNARRSANAASPASRPVPSQSAAHIQDTTINRAQPKATTKAQPKSDAKARKNSGSRQQQLEVIDLCSDEDHEPQPQPSAQSNTAVRAPSQQAEFNPPLPNGVSSFFGNDSKMVRPDSKTEEDHNSRPTLTSSVAPSPLNLPRSDAQLTSYGLPPSFIAKQTGSNAMRLGTTAFSPVQKKDPKLPDQPLPGTHATAYAQEHLARSSEHGQDIIHNNEVNSVFSNNVNKKNATSTYRQMRELHKQYTAQRLALNPEGATEDRAAEVSTDCAHVEEEYSTEMVNKESAKTQKQLGTLPPTPVSRIPPASQFKVPQFPSRTAGTTARAQREGRNTQAATNETPPSRLPLPTPPLSHVSSNRKRKVQHNVSDDSDASNFEPSSDEDAPDEDAPLLQRRQKPAVKKAKPTNCSGVARPATKAPKFGFKPMKPLVRDRAIAPAQPSSKPAVPSTPAASNRRKALRSESPSVRAAMRSSVRRAKQDARDALDIHFQRELEFHAEEDIRQADEREHRLKSTLSTTAEPELRDELRRMSITPARSARPSLGRTQTDGAKDGGDDTVQSEGNGSAYGIGRWTQDRMRGDRHLTQSQASSSRGRGDEESDSELDLSAYQYVNGRIVGRVEEMDLTENS
ncbi:hypothetical protein SLS60_004349 [Paraconiothyrium brasiliense]|uniref:Uncharacterized protein n=1 Tax=Paraconiothyrium brasiliense TaxID=300254 RepID=A0ABR3RK28_9PLEO